MSRDSLAGPLGSVKQDKLTRGWPRTLFEGRSPLPESGFSCPVVARKGFGWTTKWCIQKALGKRCKAAEYLRYGYAVRSCAVRMAVSEE